MGVRVGMKMVAVGMPGRSVGRGVAEGKEAGSLAEGATAVHVGGTKLAGDSAVAVCVGISATAANVGNDVVNGSDEQPMSHKIRPSQINFRFSIFFTFANRCTDDADLIHP